MKFLPFQKNMIIIQRKASREKMNTALMSNNIGLSQTRASHFRVTHECFSQKHFMKILPFQMKMLIFQWKDSTEKMNTVLTSNNSVTYPE